MSPVASSAPSTVPATRRSPSMKSCPTSRSFGPRTTELRCPLETCSSGTGVGSLLAGRLVLKLSHPDMAVQRRAVVDLQALDDNVTAEPRVLAEGQLVTRRDRAFDRALQRNVGSFEQRFDGGAIRDVDVARDPDLTLDAPVGVDRAVVYELAFQDVPWTHLKLLAPVALDFTVFSSAFGYRFLDVHALPPTWIFRNQALKV